MKFANNPLIKYIPKRLHEHLIDLYKDEDGYWAVFDSSVDNGDTGHTVHEWTVSDFKYAIRQCKKAV